MMLRGAIYGLSAAAIWGGMYVVSDVVLPVIPPFALLTLRLLLGLAVLIPLWWWSQRGRGDGFQLPKGKDAFRLLGVGLVGFGFSIGAQFVGTDLSTAMNGSLVTSASPAFILIFALLILKERLTRTQIIAVVLATIGVLIILGPTQAQFGSETFVGDVSLAVAALTWGLYSVLVRLVSRQFDTLLVTIYAFVGGLFLTVPGAFLERMSRPIGVIDLPVILGILYLGVVSTAGAMWLWNRSFALVDASIASLFFFAQPVVGAVLSVILLGQQFTPALALGSLLIGTALLLSLSPRRVE
jgi:drug/metabolite transporter (DMT)-like permease